MHMNTRQTSISSGMCHRRRRDSPVTEDQRHGLGVAIISTSQGLLTDRQATDKKVGGEVLAYVW